MRSLGKKPCRVGWNLKPLTTPASMSSRASRTPILPLCGSMEAKAIMMSQLARGRFGDLVVGDAPVADLELAVDGEHHEPDLALAIIGDRSPRWSAACRP